MKNRRTTFVLLPLVLAIWGMIGWKIYTAVNSNDPAANAPALSKKLQQHNAALPDTFRLIASYRDPFLDKIAPAVVKATVHADNKGQKRTTPVASVVQEEKWPAVNYYGLVKRSGEERALGFLNVDRESFFVHASDPAGALKVGKIWRDSVELFRGKERRVVKK